MLKAFVYNLNRSVLLATTAHLQLGMFRIAV
jgi:hypothetical protein